MKKCKKCGTLFYSATNAELCCTEKLPRTNEFRKQLDMIKSRDIPKSFALFAFVKLEIELTKTIDELVAVADMAASDKLKTERAKVVAKAAGVKLRAWTKDEVQLDAWFRLKINPDHFISRIALVVDGEFFLPTTKQGEMLGFSACHLFSGFEHSVDGGRTWLPCGVMEGEVSK